MQFILTIDRLDNAAFSGDDFYGPRNAEIARILRKVADRVEADDTDGKCMDICGNAVGDFGFFG